MNQTLWNEVEKLGKEKILLEAKELHLSNQKLEIKCANGTYKVRLYILNSGIQVDNSFKERQGIKKN